MAGKTVVVLGAGVGGIVAANALRQRLGAEHRIVVVDKRGQHVFAPSQLWVTVGQRRSAQITKDVRRILRPDATMITLANGKPLPRAWLAPIGKDDQFSDWFIGIIGADLDAEVVRAFHAGVHHELH